MATQDKVQTATATLDDDDKHPTELDKEFNGATLEISGHDTDVRFSEPSRSSSGAGAQQTQSVGGGFSRDRPGSRIGGQSVRSTSSRTSLRPGLVKNDQMINTFMCYKEAGFDKAVEKCKQVIKPELDGDFINAWLLTEIDHWDLEREKMVILTQNSMFTVRYNFINDKIIAHRRIMLHIIASILVGDFEYPSMSVMPRRQHGGIQIKWGSTDQLSFGQRWNPWCSDIPWTTLCHHPIIYNPKENETTIYNVDDFFESLVGAISKVFTEKRPGETLTVVEGPIQIEAYASVQSLIFNQSSLGFHKDRNGVCF